MAENEKRKRMVRVARDGNMSSQSKDPKDCCHSEVMKDLCVTCGFDLRQLNDEERQAILHSASISMIHSVPELKVSLERAEELGKADEESLLRERKLVLLVDLDQTIIHTTNENVKEDLPDVHHFQLYGANSPWYHTKLRPHTMEFLSNICKKYELHICTFGARLYAHSITSILDPHQKFFSHRILSRDECLDPTSKTGNLKALFPCGDSMVCIIDDREDVWNFSPNVVSVKPYHYFKNTGDINSPYKPPEKETFTQQDDPRDVPSGLPAKNSSSPESIHEESSQDSNDSQEPKGPSEASTPASSSASSEVSEVISNKDLPKIETLSSDSSNDGSEVKVEVPQDEKKPEDKKEVDTSSQKNVSNVSEVDDDDFLLYLEEILYRIYDEFYQEFDDKQKYKSENEPIIIPDLKEIIPRVRKQTLTGVNIVFSGVIPTNMSPERCKMYQTAKSLGANVTKDVIFENEGSPLERTTHVVAAKFGTQKVSKALKNSKIKIVNPLWLQSCSERWEKVDERLFLLKKDDNFQVDKTPSMNFGQKDHKNKNSFLDKGQAALSKTSAIRPVDCPTYDPMTGKRIRPQTGSEPKAGSSKSSDNDDGTPSTPILMDDKITALSMFSSRDIFRMGKEVEDACSEGDDLDSSSSSEPNDDLDTPRSKPSKKRVYEESSEDSLDAECPKGWGKKDKKPRYDSPRDDLEEETGDSNIGVNLSSESSQDAAGSDGSISDDMAADMLEREFLGE